MSAKTAEQTLLSVLNCAKEESEQLSSCPTVAMQPSPFWVIFVYYDCEVVGCPLMVNDPHFPPSLRYHVRLFDLGSQKLCDQPVREGIDKAHRMKNDAIQPASGKCQLSLAESFAKQRKQYTK